MKAFVLAPLAFALFAAAPASSPAPSPSASAAARTLTVVCEVAPFYVFVPGSNLPSRAHTPLARLGQRFGLVSGPRTTLESTQYYETDVTVVEPGYHGAHYWISRDCAVPDK